jgi:serine/threonine protein kinase, bacterial
MHTPLAAESIIFNRYRVVGLAGQDAFGTTYVAKDQKRFDELCWVREFIPTQQTAIAIEQLRQRFHLQGAMLYELQHPQLPRFRIMIAHANRLYLVRDYITGKSYETLWMERQSAGMAFSEGEVLRLMLQVLPAFTYLHGLGIVHQNISPSSLILRKQDHSPIVVSFGWVRALVRELQLNPVQVEHPIATEGFAAPEQLSFDPISPSTDLYGLAATVIALLTGQPPHKFATRWNGTLNWHSHAVVHPDFARVLDKMLHSNPQKRFATALQVHRELEAIAPAILQADLISPELPPANPAPSQRRSIYQQLQAAVAFAPSSDRPGALKQGVIKQPVSRSRAPHPKRSSSNKPPQRTESKADFRASAVLVASVAVLISVVAFRALSWVQKDPIPSPGATTISSNHSTPKLEPEPPSEKPSVSNSPTMPTRETGENSGAKSSEKSQSGDAGISMDTLRERRRQLEIDFEFLLTLTDDVFYAKYPDLQGQKLSNDNAQQDLRKEWNGMANDLLTKLESLSADTRGKLGSYQRADYDRWVSPNSGASLNERELNVLVNTRFSQLFPDQKSKSLNPKTFGQIWYAIAEEELAKLKPQG